MTNDVEIAVKTNSSGSSITFEITRLPSDPALDHVIVRYRYFESSGVLSWTDSDPANDPEIGDTITVSGLEDGRRCEFYPVAVDSSSNESDPGNILRVVASSGSRLTKILQAVASELVDWIPAENIQIAEEFEGKFDPGVRAAIVEPESVATQRIFNTLTWVAGTVKIHLVFGDLDLAGRREGIERLAGEIRSHFEKNLACFAAIDGYCDTRVGEVEFGSSVFPKTPGRTADAVIRLDCIVEEESQE
jgi:hypothetical protein